MIIKRFETCYWQSNMYIIADNQRCIMVDPCELSDAKDFLTSDNYILDYAFLTHEHCDHITGVEWARTLGSKIICSDTCAEKIKDSRLNAAYYYNDSSQIQKKLKGTETPISEDFVCSADIYFSQFLTINWQGHLIKLRKTPGHSSGSMCIQINDNILFCGDSLLESEPTNTRFPSGSKRQFYAVTFPWIKGLPNDTMVYPGHFKEFHLDIRLNTPMTEEERICNPESSL